MDCEYCEKEYGNKNIEEQDFCITANISSFHGLNDLNVKVDDMNYTFYIKYCPMCGRKLELPSVLEEGVE